MLCVSDGATPWPSGELTDKFGAPTSGGYRKYESMMNDAMSSTNFRLTIQLRIVNGDTPAAKPNPNAAALLIRRGSDPPPRSMSSHRPKQGTNRSADGRVAAANAVMTPVRKNIQPLRCWSAAVLQTTISSVIGTNRLSVNKG